MWHTFVRILSPLSLPVDAQSLIMLIFSHFDWGLYELVVVCPIECMKPTTGQVHSLLYSLIDTSHVDYYKNCTNKNLFIEIGHISAIL
jgi:hypothetical protein